MLTALSSTMLCLQRGIVQATCRVPNAVFDKTCVLSVGLKHRSLMIQHAQTRACMPKTLCWCTRILEGSSPVIQHAPLHAHAVRCGHLCMLRHVLKLSFRPILGQTAHLTIKISNCLSRHAYMALLMPVASSRDSSAAPVSTIWARHDKQ